jgi:hypothetical protein
MSETIKVSIELADGAAQKALDALNSKSGTADKGLKRLGETGKSTFDQIAVNIGKSSGIYDIFAGNLAANLVTKGFEIMASAAGALFDVFIIDGVKAAQEAENALNSLNVALGQSGIYSKETSEEFQAFAEQIQETTAFEDDLVIQNIALIQSLAQLDKEGLKKATEAALNLSAALGKDLGTASEAVAKAANGNFTALNKMGIQFDKTGSQAQSFANALAAIEDKFGGSATSKLNTFSGAVEQTKNNFGNFQEQIGDLIIKNPAVIGAIGAISQAITQLSEGGFFRGAEAARLVGGALVFVIEAAKQTAIVINALSTIVLTSFDLIIAATTSGLANLLKPFTVFSDTAQDVFDNLQQQADQSLEKIGARFAEGGPLSGLITTLDNVGTSAQEGLDKIGTGAEIAAAKIPNLTSNIAKLSEEQQKQQEETNKYVDGLAKKNQSIEENQKIELENLKLFYEQRDLLDADSDTINYEAKIAREQEFQLARQAILEQTYADEQNRIISSSQSETTKTAALLQIQKKFELDSAKSKTEFLKKESEFQKASDKDRIANQKDTFSTIATLSSSNNDVLAGIGKAAGITQIAIDTPVAISKALAAFPPPLNFAAAGLVGVAMAAQAARIAGINFEEGGIVPGTSFSGDRVAANVNSGEMILNRTQQARLFDIAEGSSGGSGLKEQIVALGNSIRELAARPISVQVDGREIFNITREQLASGRSYT